MTVLFFLLPLSGLVFRAPWSSMTNVITSSTSLDALRLSLIASLATTVLALLFGFPLAWMLARGQFRGKAPLRGLTTLPMVLPPVVGGIALLLAYGRKGMVGEPLNAALGISLPFTLPGVIVAEAFVAMPFFVITLESGLRSMNTRLEDAARSLGAGRLTVFRRVTLPLIFPSLVAGAVLTWSRALGEFGATITFAGNLPGVTQTAPLAIYVSQSSDQLDEAIALSLVLVVVSLAGHDRDARPFPRELTRDARRGHQRPAEPARTRREAVGGSGRGRGAAGPERCGEVDRAALPGRTAAPGRRASRAGRHGLEDPARRTRVAPEKRPVALMFQDYLLFPHLSALENVAFGLRARGIDRREARAKASAALDRLGLEKVASARPGSMSGGQQQRVAWPGPWSPTPGCCCWTSRWPRSTCPSRPTCAVTCARSCAPPTRRTCWSPTTCWTRSGWPTGSW